MEQNVVTETPGQVEDLEAVDEDLVGRAAHGQDVSGRAPDRLEMRSRFLEQLARLAQRPGRTRITHRLDGAAAASPQQGGHGFLEQLGIAGKIVRCRDRAGSASKHFIQVSQNAVRQHQLPPGHEHLLTGCATLCQLAHGLVGEFLDRRDPINEGIARRRQLEHLVFAIENAVGIGVHPGPGPVQVGQDRRHGFRQRRQ